ncbi:hypothetical protein GUJ93_ZPchr0008g13666 [Zizania palustris]|uniref:Uncharacterized protein n=1 Tax=Zizania palustris TaxID=103762 RepID=A0A8J5QZ16_ZIZPA|nr:hypothetical protein GUJ93_ZPchr0008g13666 [Zizania palustris]
MNKNNAFSSKTKTKRKAYRSRREDQFRAKRKLPDLDEEKDVRTGAHRRGCGGSGRTPALLLTGCISALLSQDCVRTRGEAGRRAEGAEAATESRGGGEGEAGGGR